MQTFVVVNNLKDWPLEIEGVEIVEARSYLMDGRYSACRNVKVINLCRSYRYQTSGYYVSLLASARGHKPQPNLTVIQDLKSPTMIRFISQELDELIQRSLHQIQGDRFVLSIYFGKNLAKRYDRLATHLYKEFQAPLLQADFVRDSKKWNLRSITPIAGSDIPEDHRHFVIERAKEYFAGKRSSLPKKNSTRYDLAILHNPDELHAPSDKKALQKFAKAAETLGFNTEFIQKEDFGRIAQFDALFIRETTGVNHHTYRFARRAVAEGLIVVDDPESILKCTNKVYLAELMEKHHIPIPKTLILDQERLSQAPETLGFPLILKQPDSSFSQGVVKISSAEELEQKKAELFDRSDLLLAQEFVPTQFDWRVGIFNRQPLYVCKYYMARNHWQIYDHANGKVVTGRYETIPLEQAPRAVIRTAVKAANLIGDGFYGVDLKEIDKHCYVIEINDNPSIDSGIEDQVLQDHLYMQIMRMMLFKVENKKMGIVLR